MVTPSKKRHPFRAKLVHALRVCLVISLLLAIPSPAKPTNGDAANPPNLDQVNFQFDAFGNGIENESLFLDPKSDVNGMWRLRNDDNKTVGLVARTLPIAKDIVGYRGPTEAVIVLNPDLQVMSVGLLSSADTQEHVAAVREDRNFFQQFRDWSWGGPPANVEVDAVSGATLTSLAMAEGVMKRLGGDRPSLVFGDPIDRQEIATWFPDAIRVDDMNGIVSDAKGERIGRVMRTGPLSDDLLGYQGPTELLLRLSDQEKLEAIRIRKSFDNEPYVDYVRTEAGFWAIFRDQTVAELAAFDPAANGVEGVSGATMTSLTIADTLVAAAQAAEQQKTTMADIEPSWVASIRWNISDLFTIVTLLLVAVFSRMRWYHVRWVRRIWLLWVVVVIGFWSGNLISMALVAGWSAEGIAWRLAPGLSAVAVVALFMPPLSKSNPYCNHLCPHGALQQLIRPGTKSKRHLQLPRSLTPWLSKVPGLTLVTAYVALISLPTIDLSSWEPFHAYLFRIVGWGSVVLAICTLAVAALIPMGYCRLGCPTGRLIDYLRRSALSDRIVRGDYVAIALLIFALLMHQASSA